MLSPNLLTIMVFITASLSAGGLALAVFHPRLARAKLYEQRFNRIADLQSRDRQHARSDDGGGRKRLVEDTLRELEKKQKARSRSNRKPTLVGRIRQGGLGWTRKSYYLFCIGMGLVSYAVALTFGASSVAALGFGLAGGVWLPHFYVGLKRKGRFKDFTNEFPNALDVVVRGLKSGLPLADCMKIIAAEAQEPVKSEFRAIVEDQTLGLRMDEAVERLAERVPVSEANFFSVVIAIQSRTGGNLSEALSNLSKVLRERKKMQAKIKAMSQEAKSSACIIGALPFFVAGAVYLTSPDYISLLFSTLTGKVVLGFCATWMFMGIIVMRKMINFDF